MPSVSDDDLNARIGWVPRMLVGSFLFFVTGLLFSLGLLVGLSPAEGASVAVFALVAYLVGWLYLGRGVLLQRQATARPIDGPSPERIALFLSLVAIVVGLALTGPEGGQVIFLLVGIPSVIFGFVALAHAALFIIQSRVLRRRSASLTLIAGGLFLMTVAALELALFEFRLFLLPLVSQLSLFGTLALLAGLGAIGYGVVSAGWIQEYARLRTSLASRPVSPREDA